MKRFTIISVLMLSVMSALACGPWSRPNYYIYSVYNRDQLVNPWGPRLEQFWNNYMGEAKPWAVNSLSWVDLDEFNESSNPIIQALRARKDNEMYDYVYNLVWYLQVSNGLDIDEWDYPSKESMNRARYALNIIKQYAEGYRGTRLRGQHSLLVMRCLLAQRDIEGMIAHWNNGAGRRVAGSVYADMERDMYAYALLNRNYRTQSEKVQGRKEAKKIYAEVGDMQSLMWLVRDQRNMAGIQTEYMADPNNPTLPYLVQDYVNNVQDYFDLVNSEWYDPQYDEVDATAFKRGVQDFIQFARTVAAQGRTTEPAMWQTAAGFLTSLMGNHTEGGKLIDAALKMKGSERVMDNARACRFIVNLREQPINDKMLDYATGELRWLHEKAYATTRVNEVEDVEAGDVHYWSVMQVAAYDYLAPKLTKAGRGAQAVALLQAVGSIDNNMMEFNNGLDNITARQTIELLDYLKRKPKTTFDKWVTSQCKGEIYSEEWYNDRIGTKFVREGRFSEALPYLKKVSLPFLSDQAISRYAAARDYTLPRWLTRQVVDRDWDDMWSEAKATVKTNQKVQFCNDVLALQGRDDAESLYRLATLYYQASYKGDCWYLTRYGQSVNDTLCYPEEMDFIKAAVELLQRAQDKTTSFDTLQLTTYALAFIPYGEPYITYSWDADYNQVKHYNRNTHEYRAMKALKEFYQNNPRRVAPYISRCDVLKKFEL